MNDKITFEALNDYLDGNLSPEQSREMEGLLEHDIDAQNELDALRELLAAAAALPREIAPERDLWHGVQQKIAPLSPENDVIPISSRLKRTFFGPIGFAAAAILLILPSIHFVRSLQEDPFEAQTPTSLSQEFVKADRVYKQARLDVLLPIDEESTPIAEETLRVIHENLERIDQAVAEIEGALVEAPDNARLIKLLIATREKERSLLQQVSRLSQPS